MLNGIIATKDRMTQTWQEGKRVPVTVAKTTPHIVTQVKNADIDGYQAVQVGMGTKKDKKLTKPLKGHFKKAKIKTSPNLLKEFKTDQELKPGDTIKIKDLLAIGDTVKVTGVSKGKGFQGVIKRWHFKGGPKTHGQSDKERAPGSIGQGTDPGRVWKGKKMAGRMGAETKTVKNLEIIDINEENGEIMIKGPVPGRKGTTLIISKS